MIIRGQMDIIRDVLKDCKLAYYDVKTNLQQSKDVLHDIQVILPNLLVTVQHTYAYDILAINIRFQGTYNLNISESLAKLLAHDFIVIQPPQLNVVDMNETRIAKDIDMLVKIETKYKCLLFMMLLYKFPNCEDDNNIL
jgi:hypothetical protein